MMSSVAADDTELVRRSLAGSREAFAGIVTRYQSLICSIAFSATGSVSRSEDLAQETFLAAWRQLGELSEPPKLRAWLCGIARNVLNYGLRSERREPPSEPLEAASEEPSAEPLQREQLIAREEETIVWRSLEQVPELYREPLVLFYREHGSVAQVAASLGLSEEVVRQRLSRGRRLLQAQVLSLVEGTLERSGPGKPFMLGVMAALPIAAGSGAAATLSGAAAKAGLAKTAGAASLAFLAGPLSGLVSSYLGVRAGLDVAGTPAERKALLRRTGSLLAASAVYSLGLLLLSWSRFFWAEHAAPFVAVSLGWVLGFAAVLTAATAWGTGESRRVRAEQRRRNPAAYQGSAVFEYRSRATCFGLPLLHIRQAPPEVDAPPARGIVAVGDRAVGVIAMGELSMGLVSVGVVSIGVVSIGGASLGLLSLGGVALGPLAFGGGAIGLIASGGLALGWHAAVGGLAAARHFALGVLAFADHADDAQAVAFFARNHASAVIPALLAAIVVFTVVPGAILARRARSLRE